MSLTFYPQGPENMRNNQEPQEEDETPANHTFSNNLYFSGSIPNYQSPSRQIFTSKKKYKRRQKNKPKLSSKFRTISQSPHNMVEDDIYYSSDVSNNGYQEGQNQIHNQPLLGPRKMLGRANMRESNGANEDAVKITDSYDTDEIDVTPANKQINRNKLNKAVKEPDQEISERFSEVQQIQQEQSLEELKEEEDPYSQEEFKEIEPDDSRNNDQKETPQRFTSQEVDGSENRVKRYNGSPLKDNDVYFGVSESSNESVGAQIGEEEDYAELVQEAQPRRPSTMLSNNNSGPALMQDNPILLQDAAYDRGASNEANQRRPIDLDSFGSLFENYQPISTPQSGRVLSGAQRTRRADNHSARRPSSARNSAIQSDDDSVMLWWNEQMGSHSENGDQGMHLEGIPSQGHNQELKESNPSDECSLGRDKPLQQQDTPNFFQKEMESESNNELSESHQSFNSKRTYNSILRRQSNFASTSLTDDRWICPICLDILINAVQTHCCHNLFCDSCLHRSGFHCPVCNCRNLQYTPNIPIRRLVDDLTIPCPNQGCQMMIVRSRLEAHRTECAYETVSCPHSQCSHRMIRKQLGRHVRKECQYREVMCPKGCQAKLKYNMLQGHFNTVCPKTELACDNNCGKRVERGQLLHHKSTECPLELVPCPHSQQFYPQVHLLEIDEDEENKDIGPFCTSRLQRRHLQEHIEKCEFRRVKCENEGCQKEIVFKAKDQHKQVCPYQTLECPHKCKGVFKRKEMAEHDATCLFKKVNCPYFEFGCKIEVLRKHEEKHLKQEALYHSVLFVQGQKRKNEEIDSLKYQIMQMKDDFKSLIKQQVQDEISQHIKKFQQHFRATSKNNQQSTTPHHLPKPNPNSNITRYPRHGNDSNELVPFRRDQRISSHERTYHALDVNQAERAYHALDVNQAERSRSNASDCNLIESLGQEMSIRRRALEMRTSSRVGRQEIGEAPIFDFNSHESDDDNMILMRESQDLLERPMPVHTFGGDQNRPITRRGGARPVWIGGPPSSGLNLSEESELIQDIIDAGNRPRNLAAWALESSSTPQRREESGHSAQNSEDFWNTEHSFRRPLPF